MDCLPGLLFLLLHSQNSICPEIPVKLGQVRRGDTVIISA